MKAVTRPCREDGEKLDVKETIRNIWCPEYDACLSRAARKNLPFDCRECEFRHKQITEFVLTLSEIAGCKALVNAIFRIENRRSFS
ncbi:MAG: hypothetical protein V2B19_33595 [Pseudomonadota bacterium]